MRSVLAAAQRPQPLPLARLLLIRPASLCPVLAHAAYVFSAPFSSQPSSAALGHRCTGPAGIERGYAASSSSQHRHHQPDAAAHANGMNSSARLHLSPHHHQQPHVRLGRRSEAAAPVGSMLAALAGPRPPACRASFSSVAAPPAQTCLAWHGGCTRTFLARSVLGPHTPGSGVWRPVSAAGPLVVHGRREYAPAPQAARRPEPHGLPDQHPASASRTPQQPPSAASSSASPAAASALSQKAGRLQAAAATGPAAGPQPPEGPHCGSPSDVQGGRGRTDSRCACMRQCNAKHYNGCFAVGPHACPVLGPSCVADLVFKARQDPTTPPPVAHMPGRAL